LRASALAGAAFLAALCWTGPAGLDPRPAAAAGTASNVQASAVQEIALSGLAVGAQEVDGQHGVAEVLFPPPSAPLADAGSSVRVFFGHDPQSGPGSTMTIAVNDLTLATLALDRSTAAGGVVELRVPAYGLDLTHPNRLRVTFDLSPAPGVPTTELFGRIDPSTLIHYRLATPAVGLAGLETYPFSLLATNASSPNMPVLGICLAASPDGAEAAAAFRALVDLGWRAATQSVRVAYVPPARLSSPPTSGAGVLVVGRLDHLPAAATILDASGWHRSPDAWSAPDGTPAARDDGLLTTTLSPWDGRTPLVLATGATDQGVAQAVAALVQRGPLPLSGGFLISTGAVGVADSVSRGAGSAASRSGLELEGPTTADVSQAAGGAFEAAFPFTAPAVRRDGTVQLSLGVPALGAAASAAEADVSVNGVHAGSLALGEAARRPAVLRLQFAGRLLRTGRNSLALSVRLGPAAAPATAGSLVATLRLPPPAAEVPDLGALPFPFMAPSATPPRIVLPDTRPDSLTAAAETAIALGRRASFAPGPYQLMLASDPHVAAGTAGLVVIGAPTAGGPLAPVARDLPLRVSSAGLVTVAGGPAIRQLPASVAAVQEVRADGRTVLWLTGRGVTLERAVTALSDPTLSGQLAVVDSAGRVSLLTTAGGGQQLSAPDAASPPAIALALLVLALAGVLAGVAVVPLVGARGVAG